MPIPYIREWAEILRKIKINERLFIMLFLISLIIAGTFAFFCGKPLKKHSCIFYGAAVIITVITVFVVKSDLHSLPVFLNSYIIPLFTRGALATALWCVVMWTGALPNGSAPIKKLMPIRGELSIFAAILTLGHNIGFGQTYFVMLFTDYSRMSSSQIAASVLTIIMLVIMIPLTVMSIPKIRRKMDAKLWKRIQRSAYIFYALLYTHIMLLSVPMANMGRDGYFFSIAIYSAVFIGYTVCRVRKWYIVRKKSEKAMTANIVSIAAFAVLMCIPLFLSRTENTVNHRSSENAVQYKYAATTSASTDKNNSSTETTTVATNTESVAETSSSITSVTTVTTEISEIPTDEGEADQTVAPDEQPEETPVEEPPVQEIEPEPVTEPEPFYIYRNGTYSASAYGYDGDVEVTITIENDIITSISAQSYESDLWYFESAQGSVISQILSSQSTNVDACSGATYSSNAIMSAVQKALDSARN